MSSLPAADLVTDKYSVRNGKGETLPPGTYFIIRATDVFAAAGLWAYIHTAETVLELDADARFLSREGRASLRNIADQATELAKTWQAAGFGRIPD